MYLIDTHCHLDHIPKEHQQDAIKEALENNVKKLITVCCNLDQIKSGLEFANNNDFIWTTAGIHPTDLDGDIEKNLSQLYEYAKNEPKIIAIGEAGLDYYHDRFPHDLQEKYFRKQIKISQKLNLPIIIHIRGGKNPGENEKAFTDALKIIEEEKCINGVIHCFSGDSADVKRILDLGLMISITGIATYKRNEELRDAIKTIPMNKLMLETDAPYIGTITRRQFPSGPSYVAEIAEIIADVKEVSVEELIRITTENAKKFFGI